MQRVRNEAARSEQAPEVATPRSPADDTLEGSLSSLTKRNVEIIAELEESADAERSLTDRLADAISGFVQFVIGQRSVFVLDRHSPRIQPRNLLKPCRNR